MDFGQIHGKEAGFDAGEGEMIKEKLVETVQKLLRTALDLSFSVE